MTGGLGPASTRQALAGKSREYLIAVGHYEPGEVKVCDADSLGWWPTSVFFGPNNDAVHLIDKQTLEVVHTLRQVQRQQQERVRRGLLALTRAERGGGAPAASPYRH